jgi:hypothetical protein
MIETGWVYVITNESMPGLAKVGVTSNRPEQRARELDDTSSPTPYKVETAFLFSEAAERIEKKAHALLADVRVRGNREWFRCSPQQAAEKVLDAAERLNSEVLKNEPVLLSKKELWIRKKRKEEEQAAELRKEQAVELKRQQEERQRQQRERLIELSKTNFIEYQRELQRLEQKHGERVIEVYNSLAKKARLGDFKAQILISYFNARLIETASLFLHEHHIWKPYDEYRNGPCHRDHQKRFFGIIQEEPEKIFSFFRKMIKPEKFGEAGVSLGHCYALGFGVEANPRLAFDLFVRGNTPGGCGMTRVRAANALAHCYRNGFGVDKNAEKAALLDSEKDDILRAVEAQRK